MAGICSLKLQQWGGMALVFLLPLLLAQRPIHIEPRSSVLRRMPLMFGKRGFAPAASSANWGLSASGGLALDTAEDLLTKMGEFNRALHSVDEAFDKKTRHPATSSRKLGGDRVGRDRPRHLLTSSIVQLKADDSEGDPFDAVTVTAPVDVFSKTLLDGRLSGQARGKLLPFAAMLDGKSELKIWNYEDRHSSHADERKTQDENQEWRQQLSQIADEVWPKLVAKRGGEKVSRLDRMPLGFGKRTPQASRWRSAEHVNSFLPGDEDLLEHLEWVDDDTKEDTDPGLSSFSQALIQGKDPEELTRSSAGTEMAWLPGVAALWHRYQRDLRTAAEGSDQLEDE